MVGLACLAKGSSWIFPCESACGCRYRVGFTTSHVPPGTLADRLLRGSGFPLVSRCLGGAGSPRQWVLVDLSLRAILRLSRSSCLHDQPCAARNHRRSTSSGHRFPFAPRCLGGAALPRLGVRVDLSLWAILRLSSFSCLHDQPCTARHPRRSICLGY